MMTSTGPSTAADTAPNHREGLVEIGGRVFYSVPDVGSMPPFLMSIVSDGDRWTFASSTGTLTAGRRDATQALFPYETDDRLHGAGGSLGPVTAVAAGGVLWRPLRERNADRRLLAKSVIGDVLVLEERHPTAAIRFTSRWATCENFGFIRTATLRNDGTEVQRISVIDGLLDVLPFGLEPALYQRMSNLTHAYKRSELIDPECRLAVFSLEAPIGDRAEPEEVLRATAVWSTGLRTAQIDLDPGALDAFERGEPVRSAALITGRPGAYLLRAALELAPDEEATWHIGADVAMDQVEVVRLRSRLRTSPDLEREIEREVDATSHRLWSTMAAADGLQRTGDPVACAHHFANVTYNVMRGGVPLDGYRIPSRLLIEQVARRDRRVAERHGDWFGELPETIRRDRLIELAVETGDVHLVRLCDEFLPLTFSRRHGDPSRPWNSFSIQVTDDDGEPLVYFEGNWRDVFQNWEALFAAFPMYLPGVISLFVSASTPDGHNPYRITTHGLDWEVPDPDDPWSNIGYWGDHQVVYLLRLLDAAERYRPGVVVDMLDQRRFTYADVPYRIVPYGQLVQDPKATIRYDTEVEAAVASRCTDVGADGMLVVDKSGTPVVASLLEKLLVCGLAKLSNYVPGGGIWMNTQRPEWNDANNALAGYGLSMVTACHLRQFLDRLHQLVARCSEEVEVAAEVVDWMDAVSLAYRRLSIRPIEGEADLHRREMMNVLGRAATDYRQRLYETGFSGDLRLVGRSEVSALCELAVSHLDATIEDARRPDGLYDAYCLLEFSSTGTGVGVTRLPEMLEGQVAVLASGLLSVEQQAELTEALFDSALYRADQRTFLLYPRRDLPSFLDKNTIPAGALNGIELLDRLLDAGDQRIVVVDGGGTHRFAADLTDANRLCVALDRVAATEEWTSLVERHRQETLDLFEAVFRHRSHLGRSGTMYAYEGIGSIYWHMVTKLLLAIQEAAMAAAGSGGDTSVFRRLLDGYERVRAGLGFTKTAAEFGAVPTDPYSHTPAHAGAQQPGMTGAVKEELLTRPLELGVRIEGGEIVFDGRFLRAGELLGDAATWAVVDVSGGIREVELEAGTVGLTICQVPVVVGLTDGEPHFEVELTGGRTERRGGSRLGRELSAEIFDRTGEVELVRVRLAKRV